MLVNVPGETYINKINLNTTMTNRVFFYQESNPIVGLLDLHFVLKKDILKFDTYNNVFNNI